MAAPTPPLPEAVTFQVYARLESSDPAHNRQRVYELVWQDGDWKISADTQTPLDSAPIPNTAGYIIWGA